jgi:hypothetical protein
MAARQHHYIPRFFLEGFTDPDGYIHVFDLLNARKWKAKPDQVARERDFYRVETRELGPNDVEDMLSRVEHELAPAVVRLRQGRAFPDEGTEEFARIANLIAMLAARVPGAINAFANPIAKLGDRIARMSLRTPERYEKYLAERRAQGEDVSKVPTWKQMKDALDSGGIEVGIAQDYRLAIMFQSMSIILPYLSGRNWGLISISNLASGSFVCSDRPVSLSWTEKMPALYGPGWGTTRTEMLLPVSRDLAILSAFEPVPTLASGDAAKVGAANARTLRYAERFIFAAESSFTVLGSGGRLIDSEQILESRRAALESGTTGDS